MDAAERARGRPGCGAATRGTTTVRMCANGRLWRSRVAAEPAARKRGPRGRAGSDTAIVSQKVRPKHALPPSTARAPSHSSSRALARNLFVSHRLPRLSTTTDLADAARTTEAPLHLNPPFLTLGCHAVLRRRGYYEEGELVAPRATAGARQVSGDGVDRPPNHRHHPRPCARRPARKPLALVVVHLCCVETALFCCGPLFPVVCGRFCCV